MSVGMFENTIRKWEYVTTVLIWAFIIFVPLGLWKLVDIVRWLIGKF